MLECIKFLLQQAINFIKVLFRLDVGGFNIGTMFCIVFILFPLMLSIVTFIKTTFVQEMADDYRDTERLQKRKRKGAK